MPSAREYQTRLRRRRIAAALLLAPVAGYGVLTGAQAARNRLRDNGSAVEESDSGEPSDVAGESVSAEPAGA